MQNLIALRFANTLFEPLWNNLAIDHVQITVAETEGVGDRWGYYDEYGAMRDMVQNHMLQLLCLVAMEPPADDNPDSVRDEKVKVLKSLRRMTARDAHDPHRAGPVPGGRRRRQIGHGLHRGEGLRAAAPRPSSPCAPISTTGAGRACPSSCAPASACPEKRTQIVIQFKPLPHSIFGGRGQRATWWPTAWSSTCSRRRTSPCC